MSGAAARPPCPGCGDRDNPADARFCRLCAGALGPAPCPSCGHLAPPEGRFCTRCGQGLDRVAPREVPPPPADGLGCSLVALLVVVALAALWLAVTGYLWPLGQRSPAESARLCAQLGGVWVAIGAGLAGLAHLLVHRRFGTEPAPAVFAAYVLLTFLGSSAPGAAVSTVDLVLRRCVEVLLATGFCGGLALGCGFFLAEKLGWIALTSEDPPGDSVGGGDARAEDGGCVEVLGCLALLIVIVGAVGAPLAARFGWLEPGGPRSSPSASASPDPGG